MKVYQDTPNLSAGGCVPRTFVAQCYGYDYTYRESSSTEILTWQGPSVAIIYSGIENLTAGFVLQNPISFAGSPNRPAVNQMIVTPTFTFNLPQGWFAGMSDYNFTWNWESGGAATIPLGLQVGKVVRIGKQPISLAIEAGGAAARPAGTPNPGRILGFEVSPIFNFHVGPGQRIKVRGEAPTSQPR